MNPLFVVQRSEMVLINEVERRKHLFDSSDEIQFKRDFAIQWLAAIEAVNYQQNCHRGWKGHKPPVEDAHNLADRAWEEWKETIGLAKSIDEMLG